MTLTDFQDAWWWKRRHENLLLQSKLMKIFLLDFSWKCCIWQKNSWYFELVVVINFPGCGIWKWYRFVGIYFLYFQKLLVFFFWSTLWWWWRCYNVLTVQMDGGMMERETGLGHTSEVDLLINVVAWRTRHHPPSKTIQSRLHTVENTCAGRDWCGWHSVYTYHQNT